LKLKASCLELSIISAKNIVKIIQNKLGEFLTLMCQKLSIHMTILNTKNQILNINYEIKYNN